MVILGLEANKVYKYHGSGKHPFGYDGGREVHHHTAFPEQRNDQKISPEGFTNGGSSSIDGIIAKLENGTMKLEDISEPTRIRLIEEIVYRLEDGTMAFDDVPKPFHFPLLTGHRDVFLKYANKSAELGKPVD